MQEQKASHSIRAHLRANLWLLVLSVVICCVLYPAAVWVVGQTLFRNQAQGGLIDKNGKPTTNEKEAVGSTRIAQPFTSPVYFQPRPSAASYNAAASGGSNLGASSPKLRGRVATLLGTIARYSKAYRKTHPKSDGNEPSVQDDIVAWFKEQTAAKRDLFTEWATNNSTIAQSWATGGWVSGGAWTKDYILQWAKDHPNLVADWKKGNATASGEPGADALVVYFFKSYEKEFFGKWPSAEPLSAWVKDHPDIATRWKEANPGKGDPKDDDLAAFFQDDAAAHPKEWPDVNVGEWLDVDQKQLVKPDAADSDVEGAFFDTWLAEQMRAKKLDPGKDLEQIPADLATTSGSGLDPDISLANARYQEDGVVAANRDAVVAAYEKATGIKATDAQKAQVEKDVKRAVDRLLEDMAYRPMFGLTGDAPIVNVLQLNLALKAKVESLKID